MDIEELHFIWDSQNEKPLYAVDESVLHSILKKGRRKFDRFILWQDIETFFATSIVFSLCLVGFLAHTFEFKLFNNPVVLTGLDMATLILIVALWVPHSIRAYRVRLRQKGRERQSISSLQEELSRDIEQTEDHIRERKNPALIYFAPYIGMILFITVWFRIIDTKMLLLIPVICIMTFFLFLESYSQKRLITTTILPRKEELESLLAKLVDPKR